MFIFDYRIKQKEYNQKFILFLKIEKIISFKPYENDANQI